MRAGGLSETNRVPTLKDVFCFVLPGWDTRSSSTTIKGGPAISFALKSTAFPNGGEIPRKYSCSGENISPALSWTDTPAQARSLALIADDPDAPAGTWTHWILWNIPAHSTSLPEGVPATESLDNGVRQGRNDFRRIGYGGPCPPPGRPHRYFFRLYALDSVLDLKAGAGRSELESAMKPHIVAQAEWMGMFKR
jgi:Raf kinase inhibitor-like YbhB/YbcL family protein